jgi:hypothetical protein
MVACHDPYRRKRRSPQLDDLLHGSLPHPEIPGEAVPNDEGENTTGVPFHEEIDPEDVGMIKRDPGSEGRH